MTDLSGCLVVHHATQQNSLSSEDILGNRDTVRLLLQNAAGYNRQSDVVVRDLVGIESSLAIRSEQLSGPVFLTRPRIITSHCATSL